MNLHPHPVRGPLDLDPADADGFEIAPQQLADALSSITVRRATVYFSPVSAIRALTCRLNTLSSVVPNPHGGTARALTA